MFNSNELLKTFNEHWSETKRARIGWGSAEVAPTLTQYLDATNWPRNNLPLPVELVRAVKRRKSRNRILGHVAYSVGIVGFIVHVVLQPYVSSLVYNWPIVSAVVCFLLVLAGGCVLSMSVSLETHVRALHLLYLFQRTPFPNGRRVEIHSVRVDFTHRMRVGCTNFKLFANGDVETEDIPFRYGRRAWASA